MLLYSFAFVHNNVFSEGQVGILLAALTITLVLLIHEIGHAYEMRRQGVAVDTLCIGFGPKWLTFQLGTFKGIKICIAMIPLGAFVSPTSEGVEVMKNLSLEKRTAIYAAGIRANFYTFFIGMIIGLFSMIATLTYLGLPGPEPKSIDHYWFISILIMGLIAVMYSFSNFFNHVVIPVLGLAMFIWLARLLLIEENIFTLFGTPVSGAVMMAPDFKNHEFTNLTGVHWEYAHLFANFLLVGLTFITLSLVLGIGNAMPIYPLDGGQMLVERIQSWGLNRTAAVVKEFGSTIAIMMIGLSVISDVIFFVK